MKRLGIFVCYAEDAIIDEYISYLLKDITSNIDELCIVSNSKLTYYSQEMLKKHTNNEIIFRANEGFDAGAFRDVMVNHYGFEKLIEFDEVVLFNDSFFGPLYTFKTVFDEMHSKDIDFWGITTHNEQPDTDNLSPYKNIPRHIQTYFLVLRKNLIQSSEFQKYWENLPNYETPDELKFKHEAVFTKYFSDLGFKWDCYIAQSKEEINQKTMDLLSFDMFNLVANKKLPILKKKAFKIDREEHLNYNLMTDLSRTLDYLKENSDYDLSLIYGYLLRTTDPNEVTNILNLIRIFPKNNQLNDYISNKKILIIAHLYYDDLWEYDLKYLKNVPEYVDILITTDSTLKKKFFEEKIVKHLKNKTKIHIIKSRGRDMASLLVASRDIVKNYDYFAFIHDKKPHANEFLTWANTFRDTLWENNLASKDYINCIIKEFDENPSLGLIVPPRIHHGDFFNGHINNYWVNNFELTIALLEQMGIKTPITKNNPPLSIGNCFWAKYDAVKPLFELNLNYNDFHEEPMPLDATISHSLERIYGYVAASRGYYTEIVMTEEYGRAEILNHKYMATKTIQKIYAKNRHKNSSFASFLTFYKTLKNYIKKSED